MIFELGDEHSALVSPAGVQIEEDELEGELEFVGIGVYSDVDFERGLLTVLSVFPGSPAEFAGLQPHDSILFVDGLPITENGGIRTLGPECSAVVITVQSPGEEPRDIILVRSQIEGNIPVEALLIPTSDGSRIGYISIPTFFDESIPRQVEDALEGFGELDGLILDVRLNSGGSVDIGNRVLRLFTDGKLGEFVSRTDSDELKVRAKSIHNSQTVPLAVLVGEDTVSMGEIFAGLLKDARGAKIAGQTSLGNVEVLNGYELDDGSWLWIAASTFDSAFSEDNWEQTGIVTDIEAYAPWDTFRFETDPSIAAALELLGHE
jgi:carboxyl-terminal processing protease